MARYNEYSVIWDDGVYLGVCAYGPDKLRVDLDGALVTMTAAQLQWLFNNAQQALHEADHKATKPVEDGNVTNFPVN